MPSITGQIRKMKSELTETVNYSLPLSEELLPLNPIIGQALKLEFTGLINCLHCQRKTNKSFSQGYCFPCMRSLAQCDMCIMKPEQCHYHEGTCREPSWGEANCFVDHYVYLANTSGLKVGITRHSQLPTRWIDQGAIAATELFKVETRQQSGFLEVLFKNHVADKTSWQAMLKGLQKEYDLINEGERLKSLVADELNNLITQHDMPIPQMVDSTVTEINYPVLSYPTKVKSFNFDKTPIVEGQLLGIKGQYLIFDTGVINMRKFSGYQVTVSF